MRKMIVMFVALVAALPVYAQDVKQHLQDISVTIKADGSQGSGVLFSRDDNTFVWTAAHVVDSLRHTRQVIDGATGNPRTLVEFDDAQIVKVFVENGRTVGEMSLDAEVLKYSDADHGEDLAILRVRQRSFKSPSVVFYMDDKIPDLGTQLYHVGSLLGQSGSNSLTTGIISQQGRLLNKKIFDQTSVTAFPGSSGGGVFLKDDGRYVAMLVRGAGETFNLVVPIRRMREWVKSEGIEWTLDKNVPMPTEDNIRKIPVENLGELPKSPLSILLPKSNTYEYIEK